MTITPAMTSTAGDTPGRRAPRSVVIAAFDKGPETSGIRTRILLKLRHAHDCSWSAARGAYGRIALSATAPAYRCPGPGRPAGKDDHAPGPDHERFGPDALHHLFEVPDVGRPDMDQGIGVPGDGACVHHLGVAPDPGGDLLGEVRPPQNSST